MASALLDALPSNTSALAYSSSAGLPDPGTEADFQVDDNPFAFTPGQLNKLFNPKSLAAFHALGGIAGIENGLRESRPRAEFKRTSVPRKSSLDQTLHGKQQTEEIGNLTSCKGSKAVSEISRRSRAPTITVDTAKDGPHVRGTLPRSQTAKQVTSESGSENIAMKVKSLDASEGLVETNKSNNVPDHGRDGSAARDERIYEIPCYIGRSEVEALGDTGSKLNFMKESFATKLQIPIQREDKLYIQVSRTRTTRTTGFVDAPFTFPHEPHEHKVRFHILPDCVHDVILGNKFLKATKTFSDRLLRARRVVVRTVQGLVTRRLLQVGESAPKITGLLDGRPREALADTGAQGLFMNEAFARTKGFPIVDSPGKRLTVQFADGSTAQTVGITYGVKWEFGLGGSSEVHELDFHILPEAPASVILSDDFLYDTDAFIEYDRYLIDLDEEEDLDDEAYLFAIKIRQPQIQQGNPTGAFGNLLIEAHKLAQDAQARDDTIREEALKVIYLSSPVQTSSSSPASPASSVPAVATASSKPPPTAIAQIVSPTPGATQCGTAQSTTSIPSTIPATPLVLSGGAPPGSAPPVSQTLAGSTSPATSTLPPHPIMQRKPIAAIPSQQRKEWISRVAEKLKWTKAKGASCVTSKNGLTRT